MTPLQEALAVMVDGITEMGRRMTEAFLPAMRATVKAVLKMYGSLEDFLTRADGRYPASDLDKMDPFDRALSEAHNEHVMAMNRACEALTDV